MKPLYSLSLIRTVVRMCKMLLVLLFFFTGCKKSEPDAYEASKCYEGTLITGFCPSFAAVTVSNANIGINWNYKGKLYKNAITITNFELNDTLTDQKIYFTIDIDATGKEGEQCYLVKLCPPGLYSIPVPKKSICIKSVSNKPCSGI